MYIQEKPSRLALATLLEGFIDQKQKIYANIEENKKWRSPAETVKKKESRTHLQCVHVVTEH